MWMMSSPKRKAFWIGVIVLAIFLNSCGSGGNISEPKRGVLQSNIQRISNPQVPEEDLDTLTAGNREFGLDFYRAIHRKAGNQFFSPYSLSVALAMAYGGARNQSADQMAAVLHFNLPQDKLHPAFNALDQRLNQNSQMSAGEAENKPFQLEIVNSIWGQSGYPFLPEYLDLLAANYGTGLRLVDFINEAKSTRLAINQWASDKTQEKIKDLIPEGGINEDTRLVLANAIYFKSDWLYPFEKNNTADRPFHLLDGSQIDVPTMTYDRTKTLAYLKGNGFQAVELPYQGEQVSMWILLPDEGELDAFETGLDLNNLAQIWADAQPTLLRLFIPKFEFTVEYQLSEILADMGMPDAFCTGLPDFSGMDQEGNLCIDKVFHKAFVAVDEKGTEAAAASATVMLEMSAIIEEPVILNVDRPFLFLILHKPSGSVLFMGRVVDPRK